MQFPCRQDARWSIGKNTGFGAGLSEALMTQMSDRDAPFTPGPLAAPGMPG